MTVSLENSKAIDQAIKVIGVRFVSPLPEMWWVYLLQRAEDALEMMLIEVAKASAHRPDNGQWMVMCLSRDQPPDFCRYPNWPSRDKGAL